MEISGYVTAIAIDVPLGGIVAIPFTFLVARYISQTEQWEGRIIGATTVMHSDRAANCR